MTNVILVKKYFVDVFRLYVVLVAYFCQRVMHLVSHVFCFIR